MKARVLSLVHAEVVEAVIYLQKQSGLGETFLNQIYSKFDEIGADPESFPLWELNPLNVEIRRVLLPRFRYVIYFQMIKHEVVITAVVHGSRDCESWLKRVRHVDF